MLSRKAILALMDAGLIKVSPDPVKIGPNSIDLRLGDTLKTYHPTHGRMPIYDPVTCARFDAIDPKSPPPLIDVPKVADESHQDQTWKDHWLLVPGQFYLGSTMEDTYCRGVVPHLDGRSTCGRLSIEAHKTAGVGDNGFKGRWTLEMEVTEPVLVAPGDRLFQIYFTPCWGAGLAHLIAGLANNSHVAFEFHGPNFLRFSPGQELSDTPDALLELDDLYGDKEGGHHYQSSEGVRGPEPLD